MIYVTLFLAHTATSSPAAGTQPSPAADPDRLLPADPGTRAIARELLARVEDLPIISPHGHVEASMLELDTPFPDPATLLVSPDHYVTRLIHASGVPLETPAHGRHHGR